jgi:hypothetical protein
MEQCNGGLGVSGPDVGGSLGEILICLTEFWAEGYKE